MLERTKEIRQELYGHDFGLNKYRLIIKSDDLSGGVEVREIYKKSKILAVKEGINLLTFYGCKSGKVTAERIND